MLSGKNLQLRAPEPSDMDLLYQWENDTTLWKASNTLIPFSRFQLEEYIMNAKQDIFAARQLRLMIDLCTDPVNPLTIGSVDLFEFDPMHLRAGVGILISEQYRKMGYAREALEILIRYSFTMLQLHQLYCNILAGNDASCSLFEHLGFIRCGVKADWNNEGESWQDEFMYQLINKHE